MRERQIRSYFFLLLLGKSYVTSIQHGGSVTLVSLSGGDDHVVHYGGSHTLPRRKPNPPPPPTNATTSSASSNGVKIRINGTQQQLQHSYGFDTTNYAGNGSNNVDTQTSLDFDPRRYESGPAPPQQQQPPSKPAKNDRRKLTLEELEVAGATSDDSASSHGGMASSMDDEVLSLSSLIEGDVDAVDSDVDVSKTGLEDTEEPELLAISNNDDEARSEGKRETATEKIFQPDCCTCVAFSHTGKK